MSLPSSSVKIDSNCTLGHQNFIFLELIYQVSESVTVFVGESSDLVLLDLSQMWRLEILSQPNFLVQYNLKVLLRNVFAVRDFFSASESLCVLDILKFPAQVLEHAQNYY